LRNCSFELWVRIKSKVSLCLHAAGVFLFIMSRQPYAAAYALVFLIMKVWMLVKKR